MESLNGVHVSDLEYARQEIASWTTRFYHLESELDQVRAELTGVTLDRDTRSMQAQDALARAKHVIEMVKEYQDAATFNLDTSSAITATFMHEVTRRTATVPLPVICQRAIVPAGADPIHTPTMQYPAGFLVTDSMEVAVGDENFEGHAFAYSAWCLHCLPLQRQCRKSHLALPRQHPLLMPTFPPSALWIFFRISAPEPSSRLISFPLTEAGDFSVIFTRMPFDAYITVQWCSLARHCMALVTCGISCQPLRCSAPGLHQHAAHFMLY